MQIPTGGIAFFDSGIGGLTVLAECYKYLPNETFYYYGDNERAPYGNLPKETILCYAGEAFERFSQLKVKAAVLACNTATAVCADFLRAKYPFPIVGAEPAVFPAAKTGGEVFVLSTSATTASERFVRLCSTAQNRYRHSVIRPIACPSLAGDIENHLFDGTYDFTKNLPAGNPASVVLGCTHYIYIKEKISSFYNAPTYDGNEGIRKRLLSVLGLPANTHGLKKSRDGRPLLTSLQSPIQPTGQNTGNLPDFSQKIPPNVYFLGTGVVKCRTVFEQMFAKPYNKRDSGG